MSEALRRTAASHPDIVAVRTVDDEVSITWSQLLERVDAVAAGLVKLGVRRGECVAIMLGNRPEFHIVDLAAVTIGATPFSIYNTYPAAEIVYLCQRCRGPCGDHRAGVPPGDAGGERELPEPRAPDRRRRRCHRRSPPLREIEADPDPDFDAAAAAAETQPDDVLTLIYTSGTTGHPKGVQLSHRAALAGGVGVREIMDLQAGMKVISWLPSAHIAERMAHHYIPVMFAGSVTCCPNPREIVSFLPKVHPTWFFAVPRIWEKLKAGLDTMLASQTPEQRAPMEAALNAAIEKLRLGAAPRARARGARRAGRPGGRTRCSPKLRAMLGLDEASRRQRRRCPDARRGAGVLQRGRDRARRAGGMSETCGVGTSNRPGAVKIGTVGPASPGAELRIAEDGEVLYRGPS